MPIAVKLDHETGVRISTATGVVSGPEFLDIYDRILADPELHTATHALVDLREASLERITPSDIRSFVNLPPLPRQAETCMAVVAPAPESYGMSRMYCMLHEERLAGEAQVFYGYDEAWRWLSAAG